MAIFRALTGIQSILRNNIADPCARQKTLRHDPRFDVMRPAPQSRRAINDLDPRTFIRCSFWCSIASLLQAEIQDGMPKRHKSETTGLTHR